MAESPEVIAARRAIAETEYVGVLPPIKTCEDGAHRMRRALDGAWHCVFCGTARTFGARSA